MKRCIATLLAVVLLVGLLPVMSAQAATQYATVVGGWLRLRADASFNAKTITSYYTGTQIKILGSAGSWYRVETPDGRTGYMYSDYLSINTSTANANATVVSGNGYGVRMRRGPSTSYGVIAKYPVGTRAQILESGKYWCRIVINGTTGYMMSEFLSKDGGSTPSYVGDAYVWSANGYGVRLRTGPGKNYSKIGTYSVGTPVKIIQKGEVWDYIQIGSRVGYMMNEFLSYNKQNSVSGVTINNMSPVIGNILAVHTVTPASATVTYEWMRKDAAGNVTTVGTNAAYSITSADAGCALQLRITGVGTYTGSAVSGYTAVVKDNRTLNGVTLDNLNPVVGDKLTPKADPADATFTCLWEVNGKTSTAATYTVAEADKGYPVKLTITGSGAFEGSVKTVETAAVAAKGTIDSVTIINETTPAAAAAPNVGDKLSAQVVPSTATVTYEWSVMNGTTVVKAFADSAIILDDSFKGCTIQLKVKGTGSYEGEAVASTGVVTNNIQLTGVSINGDAQPVFKNGAGTTLEAAISPAGATAEFHWFAGETEVATGDKYTVTAADGGKAITVKAVGTGDYCGTVASNATAAVAVAHSSFEAKASGNNIVGYDFAVEFTGNGTEPSTWTLAGEIPGMTISGNKISGQPTAHGDFKINVKVSNAAGEVAFGDYTVTVLPMQQKPVVTAPSQNLFFVDQPISGVKFTATEAPITSWSLGGTLCSGMSMDTNTGALNGTPTAAGEYTISVTATNKAGISEPVSYTFRVVEDIALSGYNTSYTWESGSQVDFTVSATGGTGSYAWSVAPADAFQVVDGKVTALSADLAEGTYTLTVTVTDSGLTKSTEAINVTIDKPDPVLPPITVAVVEEGYTFAHDEAVKVELLASGGSGSYLWSLTSENEAHAALFTVDENGVVNAAGAVEPGTYVLAVTCTDASDPSITATVTVTIVVQAAPAAPETLEVPETPETPETPENP